MTKMPTARSGGGWATYGAKIYVGPKSLIYLNGTTFDFVDTFQQKGFKFVNPQVKSECGCGESFSV